MFELKGTIYNHSAFV
jgi:hypothetical protein